MKCTCCGNECHDQKYPEVVFMDETNIICEKCSIDYEQKEGKVIRRDV